MSKTLKRFKRKSEFRNLRPVIVISTEGKETERQYFTMPAFRSSELSVFIKIIPRDTKSNPKYVLKDMEEYISKNGTRKGDRHWLVLDKDNWSDDKLQKLYEWSIAKSNRGLAVSNPQFEYWLLLHFEDGNDISNKTECLNRLGNHCQSYNKSNLPVHRFNITNVKEAIQRAKSKDNPQCEKWHETTGTTVYRLVEIILNK